MTQIREIPPHLAETFWPLVAQFLKDALEFHPHMDLDGVRELLISGMAEIVIAVNGDRITCAAVMEAVRYPRKSVGNVVALGADVGTWKEQGNEFTDALEQWCRRRNLGTLHMLGRAGWSKFVTQRGWHTQPSLIAWKELT